MPAYHMSPSAIPPILAAATVLLCAIAIALMRFSRTSVALLAVAIAAAVWEVMCAFMFTAVDARAALIPAQMACAALPFIAHTVYQLVASALEPAAHRRMIAFSSWLVAALFGALTFTTDLFITSVQHFSWGFYPTFNTAAAIAYPIFLGTLIGAALFEIIRTFKASRGAERKRIGLLLIALSVGCVAAVDLLPAYGIAIYPFGWVFLLASTAIVVYAVFKHELISTTPSLPATEIISTMRDLLLVRDREGTIRFANNAACAFLGYAREDLIGTRLEDLLVPTDDTVVTPLKGFVRDREYVFRTKMGQPIELTLSHSPVTHDGEITGAVIIGRDLRERKRYEWEAKRAVTLLQSTLDSTADGILVIGPNGRILTWNQRFADMWGIPGELMDHDDDRDLVRQLAEQLTDPAAFLRSLESLREHPEVESVHILDFKDGRRVEQYSIGRYLDDQPLRVWSFRDMTARLAAEEALRESEGRYRLLFEQNAAGVCLATFSGRIINCNATFAGMAGYPISEMANRELSELLEQPVGIAEIQQRLDETPTVRGLEIELRGRAGTRVSLLANVSLLGRGDRALVHMTAVDISDRKRAEEQVEFQAYHDALTQLPNRRLFVERLELSLATARRARGNIGVLFIDLDRFKTINDTLGHNVADDLLVEIAQRLKSCVRQTDTVARHGGDEFTIILPDLAQPEDAAQVAEKILESVAEPVMAGPRAIEISVSIGIAVFPYDGTDIDTLLRNADDAMYRAKQAGRNGYQLCTEQLKTRAMERLSMQASLRKAMSNGELVLAYLPQVSVPTGLVLGAQSIIRWNDPERGTIEPDEFIPVAEETRLIGPLGEWTLFTVCKQLRNWADAGMPMRMGVSISARQFQQRDLAELVRRAIDEYKVDPALLELGIRETTVMRDLELTNELLNYLREVGVSLAIDDFGSAYSSLGSLRVLPVNAVRMDRKLIERVSVSQGDVAIVNAVIGVSHGLGLRVGADGVATSDQFEFLRGRDCDEAQGPYFSQAIDPESFKLLVQDSKPLPHVKPPGGVQRVDLIQ